MLLRKLGRWRGRSDRQDCGKGGERQVVIGGFRGVEIELHDTRAF